MGGAAQQERIWRHALIGLASHSGVTATVEAKKVCVDTRLQWKQAKSIRRDAVIRTTLALPMQALRRMVGQAK